MSDLSSDEGIVGFGRPGRQLRVQRSTESSASSVGGGISSADERDTNDNDPNEVMKEDFYSILDNAELTMYHDTFVDSGFETMNDIFQLTDKELMNLLDNILGMTKLHVNQFVQIVHDLKTKSGADNDVNESKYDGNGYGYGYGNENGKKTNVSGFELTSMQPCPEKEMFLAMEDRIDEISMICNKISQAKELINKNREDGTKKLSQYFDEIRKIIDTCEKKSIDDMTKYLETRKKALSQIESNINDLQRLFNNCMIESQKHWLNGKHNESLDSMRQCMMQNHVSNNVVPSVSFDFQFSHLPHINKPLLIPQDVPLYIPKQSPYSSALNSNAALMSMGSMMGMPAITPMQMGPSSLDNASPFGNMSNMMNFGNLAPLPQDGSGSGGDQAASQAQAQAQTRRSSMPGMHIYASLMAQQAQVQAHVQARFNMMQQQQVQQARARAASMGFGGYMMGSAFNDPMTMFNQAQAAMGYGAMGPAAGMGAPTGAPPGQAGGKNNNNPMFDYMKHLQEFNKEYHERQNNRGKQNGSIVNGNLILNDLSGISNSNGNGHSAPPGIFDNNNNNINNSQSPVSPLEKPLDGNPFGGFSKSRSIFNMHPKSVSPAVASIKEESLNDAKEDLEIKTSESENDNNSDGNSNSNNDRNYSSSNSDNSNNTNNNSDIDNIKNNKRNDNSDKRKHNGPRTLYTKTDLTHSVMRDQMKVANLILQGKDPQSLNQTPSVENINKRKGMI